MKMNTNFYSICVDFFFQLDFMIIMEYNYF